MLQCLEEWLLLSKHGPAVIHPCRLQKYQIKAWAASQPARGIDWQREMRPKDETEAIVYDLINFMTIYSTISSLNSY